MSASAVVSVDEDHVDQLGPAIRNALFRIASLDWREDPAQIETVREESLEILGHFEGLPPHVALLDDGRKVNLLTPLAFVHASWDPWPVPAGVEADGASIPRPFWTLIGGPFEGRYRNASIVHDYYCDTESRPWRDVHRMFYEAMLAGGVGKAKAKVMYYAVYRFGPRWDTPGLEAVGEGAVGPDATPEPLTDAAAESLAADAEAIYLHDLDLTEIERLAEARNAQAGGELEALEGAADDAQASELARKLVVVGGRGDAHDHVAVVTQATLLPKYLLRRFKKKGVRIVACRDSVTDFETDLRGVVPRGWQNTGKTWDDVPGAYMPDRKRVVIATTAGEGGNRIVPGKDLGSHGSVDLVVHECLHGYDYISGHAVLNDPNFRTARMGDLHRLGAYEKQDGQAGLEETFAESGARFAAESEKLRGDWPQLYGYWRAGPSEAVDVPRESLESVGAADDPIGVAEMREDGTISVELRAEGPGGAVGHASFAIAPEHADYAAARSKFLGAEGELEGATRKQQVLIRP